MEGNHTVRVKVPWLSVTQICSKLDQFLLLADFVVHKSTVRRAIYSRKKSQKCHILNGISNQKQHDRLIVLQTPLSHTATNTAAYKCISLFCNTFLPLGKAVLVRVLES